MFRQKYQNLNLIEISSQRLVKNYHNLEKKYGTRIAPVLKSNAYGHGIALVGKILDKVSAPFFCVDSLFEAYQLSKAGIKTPILIMGYTAPASLAVKKMPFAFAVFTYPMLEAVKKYQPHAPVHIFVDTGMRREGVLLKDFPAFVQKAKELGLRIEGLMTHLATPKNSWQLKNFQEAQKILPVKYFHPGNVWRVGLELYEGVLTFKATIVQIKEVQKGERVGYDFTYTAKRKMKIGIVSAGYNDGVDRRLSNIAPFVGRISMNMCTVDMRYFPNKKEGEQIVLPIKNEALFPYETLVHLNPATKRVVI